MDPITAFAAAQAALGMIRKGVDFYKECKAASADVSEITSEISGHIGKFLDAKSVVQEAAAKAKDESEQSEDTSQVNSKALNNVMMEIQLENAEKELREMLVYHTPGLGAVWSRFEKERDRLWNIQKERLAQLQEIKDEFDAGVRARKIRRMRRIAEFWDEAYWICGIVFGVLFFSFLMYLTVEYRIDKYPEFGNCFPPKYSAMYNWWTSLDFSTCR